MKPQRSEEDSGEGTSAERRRRAATEPDLNLEDFRSLLKALKITLPKDVLNDEVINKSKLPIYNKKADAIVNNLKKLQLRFVLTPRLQCRTIKKAHMLKMRKRVRDLTRMLFFEKRKKSEKTLKQIWRNIPLQKRPGFRIKATFQEISKGNRTVRGGKMGNPERNEMKCLKFFISKNKLSGVRYRKKPYLEFGFLSGRPDFLIQTNGNKAGASEHTIIECKGTRGDMVGKVFTHKKGNRAKLQRDHQYYYQTQAYLYIMKNTRPPAASVSAAMVIRKYQEEEEEEEEDDDDDDDNNMDYNYKDDHKEPKGEFSYDYVTKGRRMFEKLNDYCKTEALPIYLAVLMKIFEKKREKKKNKKAISTT